MEKLKFVDGRVTVAVGEGAGKRHQVLEAPGVEVFKNEDGNLLIKTADTPTEITHPEHGVLTIPANDEITVYIQEEYSERGYRQVVD